MNATELTFGIEIECTLPAEKIQELNILVGGYHCGRQIPGLANGWNAQRDGSIRPDAGFVGVEVVSPILKGEDGVAQVKAVAEWLNANGAKVNGSCGFHVHVGFAGSARTLAQLVCLVARNEKALYAMTGTKNRERGHFCKPIKDGFREVGKNGKLSRTSSPVGDRYHLLNLSNLAHGGRPTVEFRCFAGTLNVFKMLAYVQIAVGLVQKAHKTKSRIAYDAKALDAQSPIKGGGEGEVAVNRLFFSLFWKFNGGFRGTATQHPKWTPLGVIDGATLEQAGQKCLEMARKYDTVA